MLQFCIVVLSSVAVITPSSMLAPQYNAVIYNPYNCKKYLLTVVEWGQSCLNLILITHYI